MIFLFLSVELDKDLDESWDVTSVLLLKQVPIISCRKKNYIRKHTLVLNLQLNLSQWML